jgi:hypothetical protein
MHPFHLLFQTILLATWHTQNRCRAGKSSCTDYLLQIVNNHVYVMLVSCLTYKDIVLFMLVMTSWIWIAASWWYKIVTFSSCFWYVCSHPGHGLRLKHIILPMLVGSKFEMCMNCIIIHEEYCYEVLVSRLLY